MKFHEMYPRNPDYLYAADFADRDVTLTFADPAVTQEPGMRNGQVDNIWHFVETKRVYRGVPKTNGVCARALFGGETDDWPGHQITLYPAPDTSGLADDGLCIRVKGSPEIERNVVFKAQIGQSKQTFTLVPTKAGAAAVKEPEPKIEDIEVDPVTGEVDPQAPVEEPQPEVKVEGSDEDQEDLL